MLAAAELPVEHLVLLAVQLAALVVQLVVHPAGHVAGAAVSDSEIDDEELLVCLQERMEQLSFPSWAGANMAIIAYPLELRPAE